MRVKIVLAGAAAFVMCSGSVQTDARQLGSRSAEEWSKTLDTPARIAGLRIDEVVAHMALKPGERVADIGAGTGVFSLPMAKAVLPGGVVYSVEIEQGLLDLISRKVTEQHATNVQTVLGKFADPNLPVTDIDVALFHDVLHHIEDRASYLKALARYLKPSARIAVVEYDPARAAAHKNQPEMQLTREQAAALMAQAGFRPAQDFTDMFTDKWFVVYERAGIPD